MAIFIANKKFAAFLMAALFALIFSILISRLTVFSEIENRTWDWRVKLTYKSSEADKNIRVIEVDQRSLDEQALEGYTWPWPRQRYTAIVKFLELAGARGLAFDILFTESSSYGKSDDKKFSEALESTLPILQIAAVTDSELEIDEGRLEEFARDLSLIDQKHTYSKWLEDNAGKFLRDYNSVILPVSEILGPTRFYGNASAEPDSDGILRHYALGSRVRGVPFLNSPFAFYELVSEGKLKGLKIKERLDSQGRLAVRFKSDGSAYRPVSADAIIKSFEAIQQGEKPLIEPNEFKDSWVYLGLTAPGLFDLKPTPIDKKGKAVEFLATVLDNIINSDFIYKSGKSFDYINTFIFSLVVALVIFYLERASTQVLMLLLVSLVFLTMQYYSAEAGYQIAAMLPFTAAFLSLILSLALQYYLEGRQHKFIRNAFKFYVSPTLIDKIVKNPESLSLGGERRELTVFFSDIAGFTGISEKLEPSKLVSLMNSFLSEMTSIVQANKGTVDKYIGDAIVAFWNAPLEVEDHAFLAVRTAIQCQERLKELSKIYLKEYGVEIKMRVGINTAIVNVGNFGSRERFSYTVIGDGVNLASRLEGVNKIFSTLILITKSTFLSMKGRIPARKIADIQVVGKTEAVEIFEPFYSGGSIPLEKAELFSQGLSAYYEKQREKALTIFQSLVGDPVSEAYIIRLESDLNKGEDVHWSPVWALTTK